MRVKNKYLILKFFIITFILAGVQGNKVSIIDIENKNNQDHLLVSKIFLKESERAIHSLFTPIYINGNENFSQEAKVNKWAGDGSKNNPYIIENYVISSDNNFSASISIYNVSAYFIIQYCYLYSSQFGYYGIYLNSTSNGIITNNTIVHTIEGIKLNSSTNIIIQNNALTDNYLYGIHLQNSNTNRIYANNITNNNNFGIRISSSNENLLANNEITNNGVDGITISRSENNIILNNIVGQNLQYGISLDDSSNNNQIINCTLYRNGFSGIAISYNKNNIIIDNIITNNQYGLYLEYSSNNFITENVISNNTDSGIILISLSNNNTFFNNLISYNGYYGIELRQNSIFNIIYNNAFIYNNHDAVQAFTDSNKNFWSINTTGNYWNNYNGLDFDNDGIGDTPYMIDGDVSASDSYPLMNWHSFKLNRNFMLPQLNTIITYTLDVIAREIILGLFIIFLWLIISKKSIFDLKKDLNAVFINFNASNNFNLKNVLLVIYIFFISMGSFFLVFECFKIIAFSGEYSLDSIFAYLELPIPLSIEILVLMMSFVITPILEEILFRGLLLYTTENANWPRNSIYLFQITVFCVIHIPSLLELSFFYFIVYIANICLLGFYFTWIMLKTHNLLFPILAHSLWNIQVDGLNLLYAIGYVDITKAIYLSLIIIGIVIIAIIIAKYVQKTIIYRFIQIKSK